MEHILQFNFFIEKLFLLVRLKELFAVSFDGFDFLSGPLFGLNILNILFLLFKTFNFRYKLIILIEVSNPTFIFEVNEYFLIV